ncbi:ATP-grasp domain-containing protein [Roseospira navarrensis]|uniref:ATP-grasp domain-containing protein n=1 Tax=Roseospira navarrensis TaxID=140058 RepID=A0A7X1ZFH1_9PROT|nr:ATP-grasp domain-containing protein [Roseospira navarrensis]MQX37556.1 ATP-grasp domain-containing protein [Roseospira navarrensis]
MRRAARLDQIRRAIHGRRVVWFGNRASDGEALAGFPELACAGGIIAPAAGDGAAWITLTLEDTWGRRVDLNTANIDAMLPSKLESMRTRLLRLLRQPSVLMCYRPSAFLSSLIYPSGGSCLYWGLPHLQQRAFEYKPWVESRMEALGLRVIPWRHYSVVDWPEIMGRSQPLPCVVRMATGSGGAAITLARDLDDIHAFCNRADEGIVSVSTFMQGALPLSVNAVVFADGTVTTSAPSLQLLGLADCTTRPFGFCGNDFAFARGLDPAVLDELDEAVTRMGGWLAQAGYRGCFGADFLLSDGDLYFTEINPRFTASSALAARQDADMNETDIVLEHMAAFAGLAPVTRPPLRERVAAAVRPRSQIMVFNRSDRAIGRAHVEVAAPDGAALTELPRFGHAIEPEAQFFKVTFDGGVTDPDGAVTLPVRETLRALIRRFTAGAD